MGSSRSRWQTRNTFTSSLCVKPWLWFEGALLKLSSWVFEDPWRSHFLLKSCQHNNGTPVCAPGCQSGFTHLPGKVQCVLGNVKDFLRTFIWIYNVQITRSFFYFQQHQHDSVSSCRFRAPVCLSWSCRSFSIRRGSLGTPTVAPVAPRTLRATSSASVRPSFGSAWNITRPASPRSPPALMAGLWLPSSAPTPSRCRRPTRKVSPTRFAFPSASRGQ